MKLLHLNASPRGENSRTLSISSEFLKTLETKHPNLHIEELDLFNTTLPAVHGNAIDAKYNKMQGLPMDDATKKIWEETAKISNHFLSFDMYVITSPMWNFTIPYKLKHYIDVIMQAGILFKFTETGVEGLAHNKKMICISSSGNDYSVGSPYHKYNFHEPYLRAIFGLAGIYDIVYINAPFMDITPEMTQSNLDNTRASARQAAMDMVI